MVKLIALAATLLAAAGTVPAERAAELEHMVRQDCGSCHGLRMTGGLGSPITPKALAGRSVEDLSPVILDGLPGTAMPGWRPLLTEDEARWIARYLLTERN
ncbi:c-type cytochrome [Paracoccus sp. (in: a-proteobacteria)]|uniref:c-type cytochrome n=1 Tax=Paracoccus sp. TaxID=267 RepID=UPI003A83D8BB